MGHDDYLPSCLFHRIKHSNLIFFLHLISYLYYLLQSLVFGVIGLSFSSLLKRKLSYGSLVSLSIIAMTPATILNTIFFFWLEQINYFLIATFLLSIGYLFFAVKVNPSKKNIGNIRVYIIMNAPDICCSCDRPIRRINKMHGIVDIPFYKDINTRT